ncbi:nuclear transport factor 2 family protein [Robertkochia aurantiaca]|uniref:nuclear transport factor 2 family protein n=1 Tax=Robertkochia aurantiaca TaxID=2873700 RepID=UPI001CCFAD87|nr:nuclear transport factor 2 family protein [Robertkochia sp. 3YJGBD-33]
MKVYIPFLLLIFFSMNSKAQPKAETVVQNNLDHYNQRDIEGFLKTISQNAVILNFNGGEAVARGKEEIRELYSRLFANSPDLHSEILKRIVFQNKVIDHEYITGRNGNTDPVELVLIYEVQNDLIERIHVIRP